MTIYNDKYIKLACEAIIYARNYIAIIYAKNIV